MRAEIVLPALPAAAILADLALAICLLAATLLAIAIADWLLRQARAFAGSLPFVGGRVVSAIDSLRQALFFLMVREEGYLKGQLHWLAVQVRALLHVALDPLFGNVWGALVAHDGAIRNLQTRTHDLEAWKDGPAGATFGILIAQVGQLLAETSGLHSRVADWDDRIFPGIAAGLGQLRAETSGLHSRVADWDDRIFPGIAAGLGELDLFLPLLRQLATYPGSVAGTLDGLQGRVGTLERGATQLDRDLQRVLPLALITALGAAAVGVLVRVAEDPCYCLSSGLSDIPARVSALEGLGP